MHTFRPCSVAAYLCLNECISQLYIFTQLSYVQFFSSSSAIQLDVDFDDKLKRLTISGLSDDVEVARKFVKTNYLDVICTDKLEVVQPGDLCVIIILLLLMRVLLLSFCLLFDVLFLFLFRVRMNR